MKIFTKIVFGIVTLTPSVALAALTETKTLVSDIASVIRLLTPTVAALALLYFFWGLAKFILNSDNEEKRKEGKQVMMWGIVALFVLVSIWGIVIFLRGELSINYAGDSRVPAFSEFRGY